MDPNQVGVLGRIRRITGLMLLLSMAGAVLSTLFTGEILMLPALQLIWVASPYAGFLVLVLLFRRNPLSSWITVLGSIPAIVFACWTFGVSGMHGVPISWSVWYGPLFLFGLWVVVFAVAGLTASLQKLPQA